MPFGDPGCLGLVALLSEAANSVDALLLNGDNRVDQSCGVGETVRAREHLKAAAPVGRLGVAQPAHALGVIPERSCVLEGIGDIMQPVRGAGVVPVEDSDWLATAPGDVPRPEVAMADYFITYRSRGRGRPAGCLGWTIVGNSVVVVAKQVGEGDQASVIDDFGPAVGTGLAADPGQDFTPLLIEAEYAGRSVIADDLKMAKQPVHRRRPRPNRPVHRVADPLHSAKVL